jgi:hypothetical protein
MLTMGMILATEAALINIIRNLNPYLNSIYSRVTLGGREWWFSHPTAWCSRCGRPVSLSASDITDGYG